MERLNGCHKHFILKHLSFSDLICLSHRFCLTHVGFEIANEAFAKFPSIVRIIETMSRTLIKIAEFEVVCRVEFFNSSFWYDLL